MPYASLSTAANNDAASNATREPAGAIADLAPCEILVATPTYGTGLPSITLPRSLLYTPRRGARSVPSSRCAAARDFAFTRGTRRNPSTCVATCAWASEGRSLGTSIVTAGSWCSMGLGVTQTEWRRTLQTCRSDRYHRGARLTQGNRSSFAIRTRAWRRSRRSMSPTGCWGGRLWGCSISIAGPRSFSVSTPRRSSPTSPMKLARKGRRESAASPKRTPPTALRSGPCPRRPTGRLRNAPSHALSSKPFRSLATMLGALSGLARRRWSVYSKCS